LTFAELLKVTELLESLRDGRSLDFQEKLTEVLERLLVLVHGILLQLNGLVPELVNMDTSTELSLTIRSTESVQVPATELRTMLIVKMT
jgi:hypothetical protein